MCEDGALGRMFEVVSLCIVQDGRTIVRTHGPLSITA